MAKIVLISGPLPSLAPELQGSQEDVAVFTIEEFSISPPAYETETTTIYSPARSADSLAPDLEKARQVFQNATGGRQFILLSSALAYGIGPGRLPLVTEDYSLPGCESQKICEQWRSLESLAAELLGHRTALTILRLCPVADASEFPALRLAHRWIPTLPGHDPVFQFLGIPDLARAIIRVLERRATGTFNVAPESVVPLHHAVRMLRGIRLPIPRTLQRLVRSAESLEYMRYSWTISGEKMQRELGFTPELSSAAALQRMHSRDNPTLREFDQFGMDKDYIRFYGATLFKFLSDAYWRIEDRGMEYIPKQGRGLLVGMHRGFMPFDGVMALHTIVRKTGRYPRFLTHPGLLKFPFLANFMTKLGGVVACQESADRILKNDGLLGIFPEGIHGAFTRYRDAYKLQAFGRDAFVKLALRHQAPIVPFVTVGSAEIFPILGKIKSRRWTRYTDWPFIPVTPTFPLLPAPLPSKWHTQFLPPISTDQYPPEAADDRAVVKAISREVRMRMQQAVDDMLSRRSSVFFGSIFDRRPDESQSKPAPIQ